MTDLDDLKRKYAEEAAGGENTILPPPPAIRPLTFDIVWIDGDRSPVMFVNITGSAIGEGFLTLYGNRISHLINLSQVSHVNIWEEQDG